MFERNYINIRVYLLLLIFLLNGICAIAQQKNNPSPINLNYARGADLSFLKQAEDSGYVFRDEGEAKPGLDIFRSHGYNWIRLRLFHSPDELPNDLEYTIELAKEAKERGFKFLLDYHYADSWADPGKQPIPEAWKGLEPDELADSVFTYTRNTIRAFREAGVMPEMVQVGNEVSNGMLWPVGKLPDHWDNFASFLKTGIDGIDAGRGQAQRPLIMIHYANGADMKGSDKYFNKINSYGISYDLIGLSYYPWWHGTLLELRQNLLSLFDQFSQDIIIVETAYNWQYQTYKNKPAPFPETPEGQKEFFETLNRMLLSLSTNRIKGVFWWEPAAPQRPHKIRGQFDDNENALPVLKVFDKFTRANAD